MLQAQNTVFIFSDEHHRNVAGCYGHPFVRTPNIDWLASRGTRFTDAYCNSPICVPSRAALATGRYVNRTGCWDNATPYHGQLPSWHHLLRDSGSEVVSFGKLHFRSTTDDNGFSREVLPMHVLNGKGDLKGLLRRNPPPKKGAGDLAMTAGVGTSDYFEFDRAIAQAAAAWIARASAETAPRARPWALFIGFVMPHFPLVVPDQYYSIYADLDLAQLRQGLTEPPSHHPVMMQMRSSFDYDSYFDDDRRAAALRAYFGMVTALDDNIGTVLSALRQADIDSDTRVLYASDHGDNLGNRGMWGKSVLYEDSAAIPLIAVGDGFPVRVEPTPVSLVDLFPTMLDSTGTTYPGKPEDLDGKSLFEVVQSPDPDRAVLSEYHAVYARAGHFMLRQGDWKLVFYLDGPAQLFDLKSDPAERVDLGADPAHAHKREQMIARLRTIVDPEQADAQAFTDQAAVIAANGGVDAVLHSADIPHTPVPMKQA